jgi:uncharacterized small protein (DUF1192 family)
MSSHFRIRAKHRALSHRECLVMRAEALSGLLEEMSERLHLMRDELWQLRAELAQQGGEQ